MFREVLLEAALFVPAVAAKYIEVAIRMERLKIHQQCDQNTRQRELGHQFPHLPSCNKRH